jgi:hypothetical protein
MCRAANADFFAHLPDPQVTCRRICRELPLHERYAEHADCIGDHHHVVDPASGVERREGLGTAITPIFD